MRVEIRADSLPFMLTEFRERFRRSPKNWRWTGRSPTRRSRSASWSWCRSRNTASTTCCPLAVEGTRHRDPLRHLQPRHLPGFRRVARHSLPPRAGDARQQGPSAYAEVQRIFDEVGGDTMVLARYMQILSPELCAANPGQIINIHHSFLPSFVGARPHHQAYQRGVKLIGATCHYVTSELDQGPIIEQDVIRIDHSDSVEDMVRYGKDIERPCSPAACAITSRTGCWCMATRRWCMG